MNTREAFEAWYVARFGRMPMRSEHVNGYANSVDHEMWEAWQTGAAWAARECVGMIDDIADDDLTANRMHDAIRAKFPEAFQ